MTTTTGSLPEAFLERLGTIMGAENLPLALEQFERPAPAAVRFNPLRGTIGDGLAEFGASNIELQPIDWRSDTYLAEPEHPSLLARSVAFAEGRIYLQNLSSILAAHLLQAQPGEQVLDLAAAPGGKTLVLASDMCNRGRIAAVESVKARFFRLQANIECHGASCVALYLKDGRRVGRQCPARFDRVLLDAPCSSEARFVTSKPDTWRFWSEKKIRESQRKQKQLLYAAIQAVKPGGLVLYSTCSFAPEENEAVVDRQLQIWGEQLSVVPLSVPIANFVPGLAQWRKQRFDPRLNDAIRILPNPHMHGFFICLLEKRS